ncbi:protein smoothened isoform X1 [Amyelois transitella]|uniref:protein smoothened isoform X1 n=2 Tax=Amyelois transitella TaxID=680683 RepID=UPI00298FF9D0|nr:protein smoothened isoform X1 [Amyelois transitella]
MMLLVKCLTALFTVWMCHASQVDHGADKNSIIIENTTEILEPINGTINFRLIKPNRATPWYPEREMKLDSCVRKARCEPLDRLWCLGSKLPYDKTSVLLTFYENQSQIQAQLELYKQLINVPKCWAVIQPFLCATFMPKCEEILGQDMVYLPSFEMCKITMEPCAIVYNTTYFPSFLKCNTSYFPTKCETPAREMKFNTTGKCIEPLIHTDKVQHFYEGISGCGLPCRDPLYTEDEHQQIHRLVAWGAGICLALNLLTVATFLIDWRSANKYPALVIFYINVCFAVASMGWLVQFGVGSRDDIICSKDGTRRRGEPSAEENLSCVVVFVLVYYFMMAACVWFVIFTYAWHMSFRALGKIQDRIDKKAAYFHLVAWSLPLVLTIATMAFGEVDGSSVTGVCFVGYANHGMRAALLLAPLFIVLVLGGYFLLRGVFTLIAVRVSGKDVISPRHSTKIRQTITRCSLTAALVSVFICGTFACHIYEFRNAEMWYEDFKQNIVCRLEALKEPSKECPAGARPSVSVLQLRLLCCFAAGALMASWTWTPAAAASWRRYLARKCGCSVETEVTRRARKHELIARAYRRRGEFAARGRLSISLGGSRQDPVGFCLDHTSPMDYPDDGKHESAELSSSWAANLPRFVRRRDALVLPTHTHHSLSSTPDRRNSQDSQISISLRHVSVESRRNSVDSQLSVKIAEMKTKVGRRRTKHSKAKRKARVANSRKESTPSIESQISRYWLQSVAANNDPSREEVKFSFD